MTTLLFLPSGDLGYRWMTLTDTALLAEGRGIPDGDVQPVVVAPAEAVTLHWAELPSRSPAQAVAAARLLVAEASAAPIGELHVALGRRDGGDYPIAVVDTAAMAGWMVDLAARGVDPAAVVPAPLLLPRPDRGYVRGTLADVAMIRGRSTAFVDEGPLTELVTAGGDIALLDGVALEAAIAAAAALPPLDLRQGRFARRRRIGIDWRLIRRLALLGGAIMLVTLAIDLVRIAKYSFGADALAARADALGRTGLARGETVTDLDRQLAERLAGLRGPGAGFSTTTAAVYDAVRATPGTELTGLDFQANGDLRLTVLAERESLPTDLKRTLEAAGFAVTAGVFQSTNGRVSGEMTVSRR